LKIKHSDFENGGEVDCGAWHYDTLLEGNKRRLGYALRLRLKKGRKHIYEVFKRYHLTKNETVIKEGTLKQCIKFINKNYNYQDEIEEE
jgi:hypothetical protein